MILFLEYFFLFCDGNIGVTLFRINSARWFFFFFFFFMRPVAKYIFSVFLFSSHNNVNLFH